MASPFVNLVASRTGLDPRVVSAWVRAEGGPAGNPLNIGPGRNYGTSRAAAAATAQLLLGSGYYRGIRQAAGRRDPSAELAAIKASPWDAGHYSNGVLDRTAAAFGLAPGAALSPAPGRSAKPVGFGGPSQRQLALLDLNNQIQGLSLPPLESLLGGGGPRTSPSSGAGAGGNPGLPAAPQRGRSFPWIERFAKPFGLSVTSTTGGVHAEHSYHYLGRAVDFGGDPQRMARLAYAALRNPRAFTEMFYTGPGHPAFFIKNGRVLPLSQLDHGVYVEHENHVHLAR